MENESIPDWMASDISMLIAEVKRLEAEGVALRASLGMLVVFAEGHAPIADAAGHHTLANTIRQEVAKARELIGDDREELPF